MAEELRLYIGGARYSDFASVELDSDVFTEADYWHVRGPHPGPSIVQAIREGGRVEVYIDEARQMAGVIDTVRQAGDANADSLEISGRDLGAFLVDCEPSMEAGEIVLQDDQDQRVAIRRDKIEVDGSEVVVCGGTKGAARIDDGVDASAAFMTYLGQLHTAISLIGGAPPPLPSTRFAKVAEGSTKVKVG